MKPVQAWIGLGSNQGDRLGRLREGVRALAAQPQVALTDLSPVWETEYVGPGTQDPYLNACAGLRTALGPADLVALLKEIETRAGREPGGHLRPRPLDLDLILHGDFAGRDGPVTVPHPRARARAFVLEPLAAIAPDAVFPDSGETVAAACANIRRKPGPWVRRRPEFALDPAVPPGPQA